MIQKPLHAEACTNDRVDPWHRSIFPETIVRTKVSSSGIDTTLEWIAAKTGILERRFVSPETSAADLATEAACVFWSRPK